MSNDYRLLADHFRLPREDIDHLAVELYEKPHGSPFLRLVGELVRRKVVVGKLIEPLQEIGHDELAKEVEEHADVGHHVNLFFLVYLLFRAFRPLLNIGSQLRKTGGTTASSCWREDPVSNQVSIIKFN